MEPHLEILNLSRSSDRRGTAEDAEGAKGVVDMERSGRSGVANKSAVGRQDLKVKITKKLQRNHREKNTMSGFKK